MENLKLIDIINEIDSFDEEGIVYISNEKKNILKAEALIVDIKDEEKAKNEGFSYFLEIAIMKEVICVWSEWRKGKEPSISEKI